MKKTFVLALAVFVPFFAGCGKSDKNASQTQPERTLTQEEINLQNLNNMRALSMNLAQEYYANRTQEALEEALNVNQAIIDKGGNNQDKSFRVQLLSAAGRKKEAFLLQDEIIPADENSPGRLFYNGLKQKIMKNNKAANEYFKKAAAGADKLLKEKPADFELESVKLNSYMFSGEKKKAKDFVYEIYERDKNNSFFKNFYDNFDEMFKSAQDYYNDVTL
ncbi:MAG: hypothetical protein LBQ47_08105 [Endomicrobium sp.]|nr:hypothetical protein [Endomicrobium sp.]